MAERIMLRLGDFNFEIATAAYQQYVAKQGARWAEQERLGRFPALQFVGQSAPEISLSGVLYPGAVGTGSNNREVSIIPLRTLMVAGKPLSMVSGLGNVHGQWVITDVSDTRTVFLDNGEARKIEFSLSLKYYGPDATGQAGPASYGQTTTAGNAQTDAFPKNMGDLIAAIPPITSSSPLSAIAAVADAVGTVVHTATTLAAEAVDAVNGLASDILTSVAEIIPQPVLGVVQDMAKGAERVVALGGFVGDTLTAITAMGYSGQANPRATLGALHGGMTHIADTTQLIGLTVGSGMDILERTATTWDAVNNLSAQPAPQSHVAEVCRRATSTAGHLSALCMETSQYAAALRDKIHVEDGGLIPEEEDARRENIFKSLTDVKDKLILCLPEIAVVEYNRSIPNDRIGWDYFHGFMLKWLHGKAYAIKDKFDNGGQDPAFVDWNWLMNFKRFADTASELKEKSYLFSDAARANITHYLAEEGAFEGQGHSFDHINLPWDQQRAHAFQNKSMTLSGMSDIAPPRPDGLQVAVANVTILALAAGHTRVAPEGKTQVIVEKVAFFIHDGFDFDGDQSLGKWTCTGGITEFAYIAGTPLENADFRNFRNHVKDYGCDFRIMSHPELVWQGEYKYTVD